MAEGRRFQHDESGATAIEYALIASISIAIFVVIGMLGQSVLADYEKVLTNMKNLF